MPFHRDHLASAAPPLPQQIQLLSFLKLTLPCLASHSRCHNCPAVLQHPDSLPRKEPLFWDPILTACGAPLDCPSSTLTQGEWTDIIYCPKRSAFCSCPPPLQLLRDLSTYSLPGIEEGVAFALQSWGDGERSHAEHERQQGALSGEDMGERRVLGKDPMT